MLNNSHHIFFYLVEGVTAFINGDLISRNLGKTLVLIWTIQECKSSYVDLYFNSHDGRIISWLFSVLNNHVTKSGFAIKKFGDRINVTWVDRSFKVELKHLKNDDTGNFNVQVHYLNGTRFRDISNYRSCISITYGNGMYRFISEFIHYDMLQFVNALINISTLQH